MSKVSEMMSRIRTAIREHDPSYRLKLNGHICAKEWREIMGQTFDFIWGDGYTAMYGRLVATENGAEKIQILQDGAKDTVKLSDVLTLDLRSFWPENIIKYTMRDVISVN
ncbi:MAG: hypothetical protein J6U54_01130 [Clostridiales bacterium]|nr:hypothetical protein [Clostridiales bacterium]